MSSPPLKQFTLIRILNAPRELVYRVWTEDKLMTEWWGTDEFACTVDAQQGGKLVINKLNGAHIPAFPITGVFYEVQPLAKLVFGTKAFKNADGTFGTENMHIITFVDLGNGKTKLTVNVSILSMSDALMPFLEGFEEGWSISLDRLSELVTKIHS